MKLAFFSCVFCSLTTLQKDSCAQTIQQQTGHTIVWDTTSPNRISPAGIAAFYPRMIQLANGDLLAAYATSGNVVCVTSKDLGKNWSVQKIVAAERDSVNMDTPELLQLKDGTIFICYSSRPQGALRGKPDATKKFDVRNQSSKDNGFSWKNEMILYEAGASFKDGCWEPSMLQLPSGEIQLFFSDEAIYTTSNEQNISMLQSFDNGKNWSEEPKIISFRKGSRDGMPVPVWLQKERKVVIAIEDPGRKNFKPYTVESLKKGNWGNVITGDDKRRSYALANAISDSVYAGAPYLRVLKNGTSILSYQSTEGRQVNKDNNSVMQVAVGDKSAENFRQVSLPFNVPEGYHAMWNSLCILNDDTIVALTSTNAFSKGRSEIWMIKGYLK